MLIDFNKTKEITVPGMTDEFKLVNLPFERGLILFLKGLFLFLLWKLIGIFVLSVVCILCSHRPLCPLKSKKMKDCQTEKNAIKYNAILLRLNEIGCRWRRQTKQ